ncbi:MAG: D-alanyl-D-alanine carboxypeptidase/D-alanyl-D-alanine-endopeptidase, partial [Bacteroidota bacterium]
LKMKHSISIISFLVFALLSCGTTRQFSRSAKKNIIHAVPLQAAHVGISVYDADAGKYLYNYQGDKYFVPASNTKIATCYAAMKYLGDSLVGLQVHEYNNRYLLLPTADPTFLHPDYKTHPVYNFFKGLDATTKDILFGGGQWQAKALGSGWSWNDYDAAYMAERSAFPIYGNVVTFSGRVDCLKVSPTFFISRIAGSRSMPNAYLSNVERVQYQNSFTTIATGNVPRRIEVPFITSDTFSLSLLTDSLKITKQTIATGEAPPVLFNNEQPKKYTIHSQPTDSLLKPLMHRSDNFFAEQTLLMVSNELLGVMNDVKIIDTILKTDFADLPQKPRWADGSGLSRYNLFTPQDFVTILNKMQKQFGMPRIKEIFATGNEGTLSNYYKNSTGFLFAKTGTLSGVVALSGLMYTKKNKLLIFSVLVNNHQALATDVRRAVEKFVEGVREGN